MGPLAPVVYWRRRAIVAAVLLILVAMVVVIFEQISDRNTRTSRLTRAAGTANGVAALGAPPSATATGLGSPTALPPPDGTPSPAAGPSNTPRPYESNRAVAACTDSDTEIAVAVDPVQGVYGGTFALSLTVRNVSGRDCAQDIGSGPQEVRVTRDGAKVWSSDDCGTPQDSDRRTFGAGVGVRFTVQWNSFRHAPDPCRVAAEPVPPGGYQVVARLGDKLSDPVAFDIQR